MKKKLIICAVPPLAEAGILDWPRHWQEIRFLVSSLAQTGANVLLSLHPKSDARQYRFLEQEFRGHLLREPLRESLPAADLFVTYSSSTVRWAVMLGIPTVLVDFYGLNYTIYDHLAGVVKVTDRTALLSVFGQVLEDHNYYDYLKSEQKKAAQYVARFDGQATQRIIDLIGMHVN